jgi:WD40 repeat protein
LTKQLPSILGPDDRLLFYFAGHGVATDSDDGPAGYVLPQDARREDDTTFLQMTELQQALNGLQCRHLLVILDCCFAGAFRWSSTRHLQPAAQVIHRERYEYFVKDPAWQVIASAAYDQAAQDKRNERDKHSPFALALFKGLLGDADVFPPATSSGAKGDGVITATELYLYLRQSVEGLPQANQGLDTPRQTPSFWPLKKHGRGEYIFLTPKRALELPPAPPLNEHNNPYRGLMPYDEEHKDLFFGRKQAIADLSGQVLAEPLTVVVGASGSGKSSLVKAGLVPSLRKQSAPVWQILSPLRPGKAPLQALATLLASNAEPTFSYAEPGQRLADTVGAWRKNNYDSKLLLIVDQLEELITMCRSNEERNEFLGLLSEALEQHSDQFHIVMTLRSDFEPQLSNSALKLRWNQSRFIAPAMTQDELREAIEGPASARVLYFDSPRLVDRVINEVVQMPGALALLSFTLSEMYFKYLERQSDERALTEGDYEAVGGVIGSLRRRANQEYERLQTPQLQATMRKAMLRMVSLEGGEIARRRVPLSELSYANPTEDERVATVIDRLTAVRLIVKDVDREKVEYVEPAHDALVRGWDRLWQWIHEEQKQQDNLLLQRRLTEAANDWDRGGRKAGQLWDDDPRLAQVSHILVGQNFWFSFLESQFVRDSIGQKKHKRRKRAAWVSTAFAVLTIATVIAIYQAAIASTAKTTAENAQSDAVTARDEAIREKNNAVLALQEADCQRDIAEQERDHAEKERKRAVTAEGLARSEQARAEEQTRKVQSELARSLYTQSQAESQENGGGSKALVLAAKASGTAPQGDSRRDVYELRALQLGANTPQSVSPLPTGLLQDSFLSASHERLLAFEQGGGLRVWNASNGESYPVPKDLSDLKTSIEDQVIRTVFSPDDSLTALIVNTSKHESPDELFVWRTDSGESLLRSSLPASSVSQILFKLAFTPDNKSIVVQGFADYQLRAWRLDKLSDKADVFPTALEHALPLTRNAERNWVAVTSTDREAKVYTARVVDLRTGKSPCPADCPMLHAGPITSAAFSSDGQWLATVSYLEPAKQYQLRLWNAESGMEVGPGGLLSDKEFAIDDISRDGARVLTTGKDGVHIWSTKYGLAVRSMRLREAESEYAAFSADEASIAAVTKTQLPANDKNGKKLKYQFDIWNTVTLNQIDQTERIVDEDSSVSFDRATMSVVTNGGKAITWNLFGSNPPHTIALENREKLNEPDSFFSPDKTRVVTLSSEDRGNSSIGRLRVFDVQTGKLLWTNPEDLPAGDLRRPIIFSMNAERLLAILDAKAERYGPSTPFVYVWNIRDKSPAKYMKLEGEIDGAAFRQSTGNVVIFNSALDGLKQNEKVVRECDIDVQRCGDAKQKFLSVIEVFSLDGESCLRWGLQEASVESVAGGPRGRTSIPYQVFNDFDPFTKTLPKIVSLMTNLFLFTSEVEFHGRSGFSFFIGPPTKAHGGKIVMEISDTSYDFRNADTGLPFTFPQTIHDHTAAVSFSKGGKWIAATDNSTETVRVWEAATGTPVSESLWHNSTVSSTAFSDDGNYLLTVTEDGTIRRWYFPTRGAEKADWVARMGEAVTSIRFTPTGFRYLLPSEYFPIKAEFLERLRAAAKFDETACFILRRYEFTQCRVHP